MRIKWNYIASLLAGTAAVTIVAAPLAAADPARLRRPVSPRAIREPDAIRQAM